MADGHDIAMALRAAYWTMHRQADAYFGRTGVTADQFVLLAALAELWERGEQGGVNSVTQQDLVRHTASDPSTVRDMLVRLERRGLVARSRHPSDGRARSVGLTGEGRRLYQRLWAEGQEVRDRLLGACTPADADHLVEALRRITDVMSSPLADGGRPRPPRPAANGRRRRAARNA